MNKLPKLIGEQCRILYLPEDIDQVVMEVAGSGKSVEAISRVAWLSKRYPRQKILLLTFNRAVNDQIKLLLGSLARDFDLNNNIEVTTLYSYFKNVANNFFRGEKTVTELKDDREKALAQIQEQYSNSTLWAKSDVMQFVTDEIDWIEKKWRYFCRTILGNCSDGLGN